METHKAKGRLMRHAVLFVAVAGLLGLAGCARQCPPTGSADFSTAIPAPAALSAPMPLTPQPSVAARSAYTPPVAAPLDAPAAAPQIPGTDIIVLLASDTFFGPSTAAQGVAARFYCSSRGKVAELVSRERPKEMQEDILTDYSVLTYRCVIPGGR